MSNDAPPPITQLELVEMGVPEALAYLIMREFSRVHAELHAIKDEHVKLREVYDALPRTLKKRALQEKRTCAHCGRMFTVQRRGGIPQRFCAPACRGAAAQARLREREKIARRLQQMVDYEAVTVPQVQPDLPGLDDLED